jgi:hypothetical protein
MRITVAPHWIGRIKILLWLLLGLTLLLAMVDPIWRATHPAPLGHYVADVRRTLSRDLPLGTPVDSVLAYLDERDIERVEYDQIERTLGAVQRNVEFDPLFTRHIQILFLFDSANRLELATAHLRLVGM